MNEITARQTPARRFRDALEPFHSVCYFVDDVKARYLDLGMHPWASYFGQRAAAMGRVGPEVVTSTFYGFSPTLVEKSVPSVWTKLAPDEAWADRVRSVGVVFDRTLAGAATTRELERSVAIAEAMVSAFVPGGRPLGLAHAAMPRPAEPLLHLWVLGTALREYRGDGHVASLVAHGVGPIEALATSTGYSNLSMRFHQRGRGWSEDEWKAGVQRARAAGWVDATGELTEDGKAVRETLETSTDNTMRHVVDATSPDDLEFLIDVFGRLGATLRNADEIRF